MAARDLSAGGGFLVDDFIASITTQLDRVQDALRIKAVNRPLTYALKELHLELKVFVDMDGQGQVMLRPAGPNEAGASTLAMDFTTITKPMIEENTISLAATRSTPLDKLGLDRDAQAQLERLGVSNLAQLERLKSTAGVGTVARLSGLPVDRLRNALQIGLPKLGDAVAPPPVVMQPPRPVLTPPAPISVPMRPVIGMRPSLLKPLAVAPDARELALEGSNLLHEDYPPDVRLNGEALEVRELDDDRLVVRLPEGFAPGALEVRLGTQDPHRFALVHAADVQAAADDPWAPAPGAAR